MLNMRTMLRGSIKPTTLLSKPQCTYKLQSTIAANASSSIPHEHAHTAPDLAAEESADTSDFKIFPSMHDVSVNDLIGSDRFTSSNYFIERSSQGNLPVYTDYKNGITYTEIRKIRGNSVKLRDDLINLMPYVNRKHIKVVPQSNKILIQGDHSTRIKKLLSTTF